MVEIKDFNALIDDKLFFDQPVKSKQEAHEKRIKMSINDEYTIGNLLGFPYHQNYCKPIDVDLSRQLNTKIPQQINFKRKLEEDDVATISFIADNQQKNISIFFL